MFNGDKDSNNVPYNHVLSKKIGINFNNYITFSIVRDPIDRYISDINFFGYTGDINKLTKELFNQDLKNKYDNHFLPQSEYLFDSFGNKVENILQFSDLDSQMESFIKKYNLPIKWSTEKSMVSKKTFKRSDLDQESLDILTNYYSDDFKLIQ
jgi:hypothetical protein